MRQQNFSTHKKIEILRQQNFHQFFNQKKLGCECNRKKKLPSTTEKICHPQTHEKIGKNHQKIEKKPTKNPEKMHKITKKLPDTQKNAPKLTRPFLGAKNRENRDFF